MNLFKFRSKQNSQPEPGFPVAMGEVIICDTGNEMSPHLVRIKTAVCSNGGDPEYFEQLTSIGIDILSHNIHAATVLLPPGWHQIRETEFLEYVIDNFGRRRIMTELGPETLRTEVLPRFTFCVDKIEKDVDGLGTELVYLGITFLDNGTIVRERYFLQDECRELLTYTYQNSVNRFLEDMVTQSYLLFEEEFPGWENPINYW